MTAQPIWLHQIKSNQIGVVHRFQLSKYACFCLLDFFLARSITYSSRNKKKKKKSCKYAPGPIRNNVWTRPPSKFQGQLGGFCETLPINQPTNKTKFKKRHRWKNDLRGEGQESTVPPAAMKDISTNWTPLLFAFHQATVWFVLSGLQGNTVDFVEEDLLSL